MRIYMMFPLTQ